MSAITPRMRMFAGPNGSGKSTLKGLLAPELIGTYINPDEIEKEIRARGYLDLSEYGIEDLTELRTFLRGSVLLRNAGLSELSDRLSITEWRINFDEVHVNAYWASVLADFLRQKLLEQKKPFTLETVMSSPDKVELLQKAQGSGYRTYIYYIATDDPQINISRVRSRVRQGGHPVPEDKIVSRYWRSLGLLLDAIRRTNRAYIFDNSGSQRTWLAEITGGRFLELKNDHVPDWFKQFVLEKISR